MNQPRDVGVKSRIPEFDSLEDEAEFWDTHSLADFEDEFEPVAIEVERQPRHAFLVRFEGPVFARVVAYARRHGLSFEDLGSRWIEEALAAAEAAERAVGRDETAGA